MTKEQGRECKVGDKFIVIKTDEFEEGDIVTLIRQDGTSCPGFGRLNDDDDYYFEVWSFMKPYHREVKYVN